MTQQRLTGTSRLAVLVLLLVLAGGVPAAWGQEKRNAPAALPTDLVAAWQKAGAKVGWMRWTARSSLKLAFVPEKEGQSGDVPAFRFSPWEAGILPRLPAPTVPFGLYLSHCLSHKGAQAASR
jgi:hypothetical protein